MNLRQFEYLLVLAETKSFQKAADQLYLSQPAVSKQITALEEELGFPLFRRGYRNVTLTPEGEVLHKALLQCRSTFDSAVNEATNLHYNIIRHIHIGVAELSDFTGLSDAVSEFHADYPDIFITVECEKLQDLHFSENEGRYDIILTHEVGVRKDKGIKIRKLFSVRQNGMISRMNKLAAKPDLTFSDLKTQRFLIPSRSLESISRDYCVEICKFSGFEPLIIVPMYNVDSLLTAIDMDLGVAVLPESVSLRESRNIIRVPTPYFASMVIAWKENSDTLLNSLAEKIYERCSKP